VKLVAMLAILLSPQLAAADHTYLREADAAHVMFPTSTAATRATLELSDSEVAVLDKSLGRHVVGKTYPYLDVVAADKHLGVIFLLDVIGQAEPITFAVAITSGGVVQDVRVMVYREPHGAEIEDSRFHKQFVGKALKDPITLGKDVDAISGATISSRSEAFAVKKSLGLADLMRHRAVL
jgi:Na+-translocating ferredoxin:NAD+ oxidoreductase RnfG subunit